MRHSVRHSLNGLGLLSILVLVVAMTPAGSAQGLGPDSPDDLVNLVGGFATTPPGCGSSVNCFYVDQRINSDGTHTLNWSVPAGKKMIVTGVDWMILGASTLPSGANDSLFIDSINPALSRSVGIVRQVVPEGNQSRSVELNGIAVDSGHFFQIQKSGGWTYATVYIRGYLVDARGRR